MGVQCCRERAELRRFDSLTVHAYPPLSGWVWDPDGTQRGLAWVPVNTIGGGGQAVAIRMTDRWLQALQVSKDGSRVDHLDALVPGLSLRVSARSRVWAVRYRRGDGSRTREVLGRYPAMTLAAARAAARDRLAAADADPGAVAAGDANADGGTGDTGTAASGSLRDMVVEALEAMQAEGKRAAADYRWLLITTEGAAVPWLEDRLGAGVAAAALTPVDATAWIASLVPRGRGLAAKGRAYLSAVYGRGMRADYDPLRPVEAPRYAIAANPVTPVRPIKTASGGVATRVLTDDELRAMWHGLAAQVDTWTLGAMRLIPALGGLRAEEVLRGRWDWLSEMTVPAPDEGEPTRLWVYRLPTTKSGRANAVPVGPHAAAELVRLRPLAAGSPLWLPSGSGPRDRIRTNNSLSQAARRWCERQKIKPRWTPRDLRRTVKTRLRDREVDEEALRLWMGHGQTQGVDRKHYDRAEYLELKRTAVLPALTAWLEDVVGPAAPASSVANARQKTRHA